MIWHYVEKEYYDHADDIEGVNIHYVCTPTGGIPDWENQRATRYMPFVQSAAGLRNSTRPGMPTTVSWSPRLRKKLLKLPLQIFDPQTDVPTNNYLLHYYFEIFQDGHRRYSPLYTEEITTTEVRQPEPQDSAENPTVAAVTTPHRATVKEPSE
ncbi:MAG: hypothetical protein AB7G75_00910 [Candidatus Binatia bacterium]